MTAQPNAFRRDELVGTFRCRSTQPAVEVIASFRGEFDFLSNFAPAEVWLPAETLTYRMIVADDDWDEVIQLPHLWFPATENAYMAWKNTDVIVRKLMQNLSPAEAKKMDRRDEVKAAYRNDYTDLNRVQVMLYLIRQKFDPALHPNLAERLLATGTATLVEGNTWGDSFFGWDLHHGKGLNYLGRILMQVRNELRIAAGLAPVVYKMPLLSDAERVPYFP